MKEGPEALQAAEADQTLSRRFAAASRWETEVRSRASLMGEVFDEALKEQSNARITGDGGGSAANRVGADGAADDQEEAGGSKSKRRRLGPSAHSTTTAFPTAAVAAKVAREAPGLAVSDGSSQRGVRALRSHKTDPASSTTHVGVGSGGGALDPRCEGIGLGLSMLAHVLGHVELVRACI